MYRSLRDMLDDSARREEKERAERQRRYAESQLVQAEEQARRSIAEARNREQGLREDVWRQAEDYRDLSLRFDRLYNKLVELIGEEATQEILDE